MSSRNEESGKDFVAEIRPDLRGDAVIVAPGRAGRPNDFRRSSEDRRGKCPFCEGREGQTPPELDAVRDNGSAPNAPGWSVRVVPNRYPALARTPAEGSAWGLHEVIVETPDHDRAFADLPVDQIEQALRIFQRRLQSARATEGIEYACVFKNHGAEAGASVEHSHSQLMAVPFVPRRIAEEAAAHRRGDFAERLAAARPVAESAGLKAFCPGDSRMPYEVWIAPKQAEPTFEDAADVVVRETAEMLRSLLAAMNVILSRPPYHLLFYTAPFRTGDGFHWRIEIAPRLARIAGFELATGVFVNQTDPEKAARDYRAELKFGRDGLKPVPTAHLAGTDSSG